MMTNEQVLENLAKALNKEANRDLAMARKSGIILIVSTKVGSIEVEYTDGRYMISNFYNSQHTYYVGKKAGAVEFLVNNYDVIHE